MLAMKPYSEDLRKKIVAAVERGMPKTEAAKTFGVSLSSVKRYWRLAAHEESLAPRKGGGRPPKANAAVARLLEEDVAAPLRRRPRARRLPARLPARRERGRAVGLHREEAPAQAGVLPKNGAWVRQNATSS